MTVKLTAEPADKHERQRMYTDVRAHVTGLDVPQRTSTDDPEQTTDHEVGGSSPSERTLVEAGQNRIDDLGKAPDHLAVTGRRRHHKMSWVPTSSQMMCGSSALLDGP